MDEIKKNIDQKIEVTLNILHDKLSTIIVSGAHPAILNNIKVNCYDSLLPINQVANIKAQDSNLLLIIPFDSANIKSIVEAINKSDLNLNPIEEGESIKLIISPMTSEKRDIFIKQAKKFGEEAKISIRNLRTDFNKKVRNQNLSENEEELIEKEIQNSVDSANKEVDKVIKDKIENLLKI